MSRIGNIVRKLYTEELKPAAGKTVETGNGQSRGKKRHVATVKNALSNRRIKALIRTVVVVLVVLVVIGGAISKFNALSATRTAAQARRAGVDRELQRRANLIPNLVYAVSKYAAYEQGVFKYVADARDALRTIQSPETSTAQAANLLEKTLSRLVALAEEYPDLKATQSIQDLIKEAANTENRIADAKAQYNAAAEAYNQERTVIPGNVFAFIFRFKSFSYIGLEEGVKVPVIDLDLTDRQAGMKGEVEVPAKNPNKTGSRADLSKSEVEVAK